MIGLENLFIYWLERPNLGTGETISANLLTREATGEHFTGALGQGVL